MTVSNTKAMRGMKNSRKSASEVAEFRSHVGRYTRYTDPSLPFSFVSSSFSVRRDKTRHAIDAL